MPVLESPSKRARPSPVNDLSNDVQPQNMMNNGLAVESAAPPMLPSSRNRSDLEIDTAVFSPISDPFHTIWSPISSTSTPSSDVLSEQTPTPLPSRVESFPLILLEVHPNSSPQHMSYSHHPYSYPPMNNTTTPVAICLFAPMHFPPNPNVLMTQQSIFSNETEDSRLTCCHYDMERTIDYSQDGEEIDLQVLEALRNCADDDNRNASAITLVDEYSLPAPCDDADESVDFVSNLRIEQGVWVPNEPTCSTPSPTRPAPKKTKSKKASTGGKKKAATVSDSEIFGQLVLKFGQEQSNAEDVKVPEVSDMLEAYKESDMLTQGEMSELELKFKNLDNNKLSAARGESFVKTTIKHLSKNTDRRRFLKIVLWSLFTAAAYHSGIYEHLIAKTAEGITHTVSLAMIEKFKDDELERARLIQHHNIVRIMVQFTKPTIELIYRISIILERSGNKRVSGGNNTIPVIARQEIIRQYKPPTAAMNVKAKRKVVRA